jgi:HPt (histidine-containing phosphotransfer) domain-containing protein
LALFLLIITYVVKDRAVMKNLFSCFRKEKPGVEMQNQAEAPVVVPLVVPDDTDVIDWDAAVEQCSGDEAFLRELLVDLLEETRSNVEEIRACFSRGDMVGVQHGAHSVKGAASNLMCHRLKTVALFMETEGREGARLDKEGPGGGARGPGRGGRVPGVHG